jgi:divinyl protochlorophyllide a 8-vinyl-reductase
MQLALPGNATDDRPPQAIDDASIAGRIGPNAITRLAQAITGLRGPGVTREVFAAAGKTHYLSHPPQSMVDEAEVIALHRAARRRLGDHAIVSVAWRAGELTGDYILAHRIPAPVRSVLPLLPARLSGDLLARAVARHAWTFAGSGDFSYRRTPAGLELTVRNSPLTRDLSADAPACHYYAATFQRLFRALTDPDITVVETTCSATGADACRFLVKRGA